LIIILCTWVVFDAPNIMRCKKVRGFLSWLISFRHMTHVPILQPILHYPIMFASMPIEFLSLGA
jgi:hypothetical protein